MPEMISEKYLTFQPETSHSLCVGGMGNRVRMNVDENFRRNLVRLRLERGLNRAELSRLAGMNPRVVKDIEDGKSQSPKLSAVFSLAEALGVDPGDLIGLPPRPRVTPDLLRFLEQYDEDGQERLLAALQAIPTPRG